VRGATKRRIKSKRSHLADLLSRKDVKEGFDRKPTTIALALKRGTAIRDEQRRVRGQETFRTETKQATKRSFHLVNLLSNRDVKEGFCRKPTTIDVREIELKGNTLRYREGSY